MSAPRVPAALLDPSLFGRHQVAAFIATCVDFGTMILLVQLARVLPPVATLISAALGGATNFALGRAWAYKELHRGDLRSQAGRYAIVSLGGALLNAGLLALILGATKGTNTSVPYPAARAVVAVLVSVVYTYPLHTRVVFRAVR